MLQKGVWSTAASAKGLAYHGSIVAIEAPGEDPLLRLVSLEECSVFVRIWEVSGHVLDSVFCGY